MNEIQERINKKVEKRATKGVKGTKGLAVGTAL
jgi:hypothetical protein